MEDLEPRDYSRVGALCARYSDCDIGFVDAAVMAMVERLDEPKLATLDHRHFGMIQPRHVDALTLLPCRTVGGCGAEVRRATQKAGFLVKWVHEGDD